MIADALNLLDNADAIGSGVGQKIGTIGGNLFTILYIALVVLIIGSLLFFILWWFSFKHRVKIKEVTGSDGHFFVVEDYAKRKKRDGAEFWKLRRRKALIPAPPKGAISMTRKGRYYAECAHHEKSGLDAGYQWIIPAKDPLSGDYQITQTQEERALLADRLDRAIRRKSLRTLDVIMQFAGMTFVLIIIISLMAFFGEISKSTSEAAAEVEGAIQRSQELLSAQADFQRQLNTMFSTLSCEPPQTSVDIPLDQQTGG